jgi:hypothetical protein
MSINLQNDLVKIFVEEVKHVFQAEGNRTAGAIREKRVEGDKAQFPVLGSMVTQERSLGTLLPIQNKDHTPVTITTKNWTATALVDNFLQSQTNFDDRQETVKSLSMGLGRRKDQLVIDALTAATPTSTIGSGSATDLTLAKLQDAAKALDANGVPDMDRYFMCHVNNLHALLSDTTVTSADFNSVKALIKGDLDTFYGFKFIKIPDMADEGGLAIAGNDERDNFAFHKSALGMVMNTEISIGIDRAPQYDADMVTGRLSANAAAIDELGIVKVLSDET